MSTPKPSGQHKWEIDRLKQGGTRRGLRIDEWTEHPDFDGSWLFLRASPEAALANEMRKTLERIAATVYADFHGSRPTEEALMAQEMLTRIEAERAERGEGK